MSGQGGHRLVGVGHGNQIIRERQFESIGKPVDTEHAQTTHSQRDHGANDERGHEFFSETGAIYQVH